MIEQEKIALRLLRWIKEGYASPFKISIMPTDRCNLKCKMCWQRMLDNKKEKINFKNYEVSESRLLELIKEGKEMGVEEWEFIGGGEPFMRINTMFKLIKEIKNLNMEIIIVTNGTFLNSLAKTLVEFECDKLIISLDGPNEKINDILRPPSSTFLKIISGIHNINKYKDKFKRRRPEIKINYVVCKYNYYKLVEMVKLCNDLKIEGITFNLFQENCSFYPERFKLNFFDDLFLLKKEAEDAFKLASQNGLETNLEDFLEIIGSKLAEEKEDKLNEINYKLDNSLFLAKCFEPWYKIIIHTAGGISPCCSIPPFADNLKEKKLMEIWNGRNFNEFRKRILKSEFIPECKDCAVSQQINYHTIKEILYKIFKNKISYNLSKPFNICLVSREYPLETGWGGIGTYTYQLAHGLAKEGHNVHIISQSLDVEKEYMDNEVRVHRICHPDIFGFKKPISEFSRRLEYSWRVYRKILELIENYHIDIVEGPNFSGECFVYSFFKKIPLVTRIHTPFSEVIENFNWPKTFDRRMSCWFEDVLIKRSDLITFSTSIYADEIRKKIGLEGNRTAVIPLGINLPLFKESTKFKKPLTVLFVGRLEKRKGIHILMEAIPLVLKEFPYVNFVLVGRDSFFQKDETSFMSPQNNNFKSEFWKKLPENLKLKVQIRGYVNEEELADCYRNCDIFVAPSLHETFGLIYLEAMSYGKPIIGTKVGGVPEVIKDKEVGLLVPPADVDVLAEAIIKLLEDEPLRKRMGEKAKVYMGTNFSVAKMVDKTTEEFNKVLSKVCKL